MTVICPACRTRYRHPTGVRTPGERGRCSRCEAVFPLIPASPSYRLLTPQVPGQQTAFAGPSPEAALPLGRGRSISIGMDDPTLAERLHNGAHPAEERRGVHSPLWVVGKVLFGVTCIGLGGTSGYFTSSELGVNFTFGTILGIAAGILLSWGWLRWLPLKS